MLIKRKLFLAVCLLNSLALFADYTEKASGPIGESIDIQVRPETETKYPNVIESSFNWKVGTGNMQGYNAITFIPQRGNYNSDAAKILINSYFSGTVIINCSYQIWNKAKGLTEGWKTKHVTYQISCSSADPGSEPDTNSDPDSDSDPNPYPAYIPDGWTKNGDEYYTTIKTKEGVSMKFMIWNLENRTCAPYGDGYYTSCIDRETSGTVTIPDYVEGFKVISTGNYAFQECKNLEFIALPSTINNIGSCSFRRSKINTTGFITTQKYIQTSAFEQCFELNYITIPNSVEQIGVDAFKVCMNATTISLGTGVTKIGRNAFSLCSKLEVVISMNETPPTIDGQAFDNPSKVTLYVPSESAIEKYKSKNGWKNFGAYKVIGDTSTDNDNIKIDSENFPDDKFRNYLLNEDFGKDGIITANERKKITSFYIPQEVKDLSGIEYFTDLDYLDCAGCQLTSLDISKNKALKQLYCGWNKITSLDVSNNLSLERLSCEHNELTSIDISYNTALKAMACSNNKISSLNLSNNKELTGLFCDYNQINILDVSKNTALTSLYCNSNKLTALDISNNASLTDLRCSSNQLATLEVSNNTELVEFDCGGNQLTTLDITKNLSLTGLRCSGNKLIELKLSKNKKLEKLSCYINCIKGTEMDNLINGLEKNTTTKEHAIYIMFPSHPLECNVCTTTQVAAIKAKGWIPYLDNGEQYKGSDPTGIHDALQDEEKDAPIFDLSGRRLTEPRKGINIIGGKKVVVK